MDYPARYLAVKALVRSDKSAGVDADVSRAAKKTDTNPTMAQIESGNYRKGSVTLNGFTIKIENPKGSTRRGVDPGGKAWEVTMKVHYGYFANHGDSKADGDPVDVFIGPDPDSELVFGIDQVTPSSGRFDEHKIMFGFKDEKSAREGYLANYDKNWKGLKEITPMTVPQFRIWLEGGDTGKPLAGQIKQAGAASAGALLRVLAPTLRTLGRTGVGTTRRLASSPLGRELGTGAALGTTAGLAAPLLERAVAGNPDYLPAYQPPHESSTALSSAISNALLGPLVLRKARGLSPALFAAAPTLSGLGHRLGGPEGIEGLRELVQRGDTAIKALERDPGTLEGVKQKVEEGVTQGLRRHWGETMKPGLERQWESRVAPSIGPAAAQLGASLGKRLGAGAAGSLGGYGLGRLLGSSIVGRPDTEDLEFEEIEDRNEYYRRKKRRENLRNIISMLGASAGGMGGVALVDRLSKNSSVSEETKAWLGVTREGSSKCAGQDLEYTPSQLYDALAKAETGGESNPFIRTRVTPKQGSSAYGPVQLTGRLLQDYRSRHPKVFRQQNLAHVDRLIGQSKQFLKYGREPSRSGYHPRYDYGGVGDFGTTPEHQKQYRQVAERIIAHKYLRAPDMPAFLKSWRGKAPSTAYLNRIQAGLPAPKGVRQQLASE